MTNRELDYKSCKDINDVSDTANFKYHQFIKTPLLSVTPAITNLIDYVGKLKNIKK